MSYYKLTYFDLPALAEPIRLLFTLGNFEWENETVTFDEWSMIKDTAKWGQLPIMSTPEGVIMTQSKAITKFLGKKVEYEGSLLYPSNDMEAYYVDEMIDALEDLRSMIVPTYAIKDKEEKEAARAELMSPGGKMHDMLTKLEKECGETYMVGSKLSVADLWAYMFLNFLRCGFYDGISPTYLIEFPKLANVVNNVSNIPLIHQYVLTKVETNNHYKCFLPSEA